MFTSITAQALRAPNQASTLISKHGVDSATDSAPAQSIQADSAPADSAPVDRVRYQGLRRALRWTFTGVSTVVVVIAIAAVVLPRLLGAVPLVVLTGSMVPAFGPGDLVISQPVDPESLAVGDVITYQPESDNPALITHRVKALAYGSSGLANVITRGDANSADDAAVLPGQVVGKYLYHIPLIGYLTVVIPTEYKPLFMNGLGAVFILAALVYGAQSVRRGGTKKARTPIGQRGHRAKDA